MAVKTCKTRICAGGNPGGVGWQNWGLTKPLGIRCLRIFMNLLIGIFTFLLVLVSIFLVLVVLMQKAKSDGAVAALGSSGMESTFGAETGNVLTKATINAAILFFVLSFGLYLAHVYQAKNRGAADATLPTVTAPAAATEPAPATPAPTQGEPKNP